MNDLRHSGARGRETVRAKIVGVVLLTTAIALLFAGAAMLTHDVGVYRQICASNLATEASILARATSPALAFDDPEAAQSALEALQARPEVLLATLYDDAGRPYATYSRNGQAAPPTPPALSAPLIHGEALEITQRVVRNGETLGTIYLRASYDIIGRVESYASIFAFVIVLSMLVALLLTQTLQRIITQPLDAMAEVARGIVERRDYSLRAPKSTGDEIGLLVDAFNGMLDEVQSRARSLEQSNTALRNSEKLYRAIGESIDYGVWVCDAQGRNVYASDSFLRLIGLTQQQCADFGWANRLHPDDWKASMQAWKECVRSGRNWYREFRFLGVDGAYHPVLAQGVAIRGDNGEVSGWAGINLDIRRLKQTEEALREADRRKDEFLATLAHELRNPLAPIGHAVRILEVADSDERQREWAREIIARQSRRMALLLDDLLDVSRITSGRLHLRKDRVALDTLVATAIETVRPLIEAKGHELRVELPSQPLELEVDPLRLSQALSNLLTNAAKYTDAGGRISLTVAVDPDELSVAVKDTGIGLSAAAIPRVFEMFSQVESAIDRAEGGLGIGLALVKGLVGLHGGRVEALSAGLGQGSEFSIRLPASVICARSTAPAAAECETLAPAARSVTIMVVDDNVDAAQSLALILELSGYRVCLAHSGRQALSVGTREQPQVAILDIGMPDMSGYEAARRIRREAWGQRIVLFAVTGWGQQDDKNLAAAAGFDRHFTKPVDFSQLEATLTEFLGAQAAVADQEIRRTRLH
jgi:PAS domain S-box-containing protein